MRLTTLEKLEVVECYRDIVEVSPMPCNSLQFTSQYHQKIHSRDRNETAIDQRCSLRLKSVRRARISILR